MQKETIFSDNVEYFYRKNWRSVIVKISKLPRLEVKLVADFMIDQDVIQTINVLGSAQSQRSDELVLFDKEKTHVFRMSDLQKRVSLQSNLSKLLSEKTYNMKFVTSAIIDTTMKLNEWYEIHINCCGIFITNDNHKNNNRVIKHWHMNQVIDQELEKDVWNLKILDNNTTQTYSFNRSELSIMKELFCYLKMFILKLPHTPNQYSNSNSLRMIRHNSCLDANKLSPHKRIRTQSENNNLRNDNYNLVPSAINNSHDSSSSTNTNKSTSSSSSSSNSKSHAIFESASSSPSPPLEADEEIEEEKETISNIAIVVNTSNNSDDTIVNDDLLVISHTNEPDRSHNNDELVFSMDNDNLTDNTNPNSQYNFNNATNESNIPKSPINLPLVDLERSPFEDTKSKFSSSRSDIQSDDCNMNNSHIPQRELMKQSSKNCYSSIKLIQNKRKSLSDCNQTTIHHNNNTVVNNNPIISNLTNSKPALSQSAGSPNTTPNMYNSDNTSFSSSPLANQSISTPLYGPIKNTYNTNLYYNISPHINVPKTFNKLGEQNYYNLSYFKVDNGNSVKNNSKIYDKYININNDATTTNNNNNNVDNDKISESRLSPNPISSSAVKSNKTYDDLNYAQLDFSDYQDGESNYYVTRPVIEISEPLVDYTDINHENTEALDRADKVLQLSSSSSLNDNHRNLRKKPIDMLHRLKLYLKLR